MTVRKDKSTEENREFWQAVEDAAKEVATWPAWKRGESVVPALAAESEARRG
jgi:hypothetical protein